MPQEIERKFLVKDDSWKQHADSGEHFRQSFIYSRSGKSVVRIRIAGQQAYITLKGKPVSFTRPEFEYPIPLDDARQMLDNLCDSAAVEKTRYEVKYHDKFWVVDVFEGGNAGLVMAEIELGSEAEQFDLPPWAGQEVTADSRYCNSNLAQHPFQSWLEKDAD
jgi:CYTH domain-containing protein